MGKLGGVKGLICVRIFQKHHVGILKTFMVMWHFFIHHTRFIFYSLFATLVPSLNLRGALDRAGRNAERPLFDSGHTPS